MKNMDRRNNLVGMTTTELQKLNRIMNPGEPTPEEEARAARNTKPVKAMKPINIKAANAVEKLTAELEAVQKRCTARTITAQQIIDAVRELEEYLPIPKKSMEGVKAEIDVNAQRFPSAYNYTPESTVFSVLRKGRKWQVTAIRRGTTHPESRKAEITLPEEARKALVEHFSGMSIYD